MIGGGIAPARNEFAEFALGDIGNGEVIEIPSAPVDHGISVARFYKRRCVQCARSARGHRDHADDMGMALVNQNRNGFPV